MNDTVRKDVVAAQFEHPTAALAAPAEPLNQSPGPQ
jgi:hypothetical protein